MSLALLLVNVQTFELIGGITTHFVTLNGGSYYLLFCSSPVLVSAPEALCYMARGSKMGRVSRNNCNSQDGIGTMRRAIGNIPVAILFMTNFQISISTGKMSATKNGNAHLDCSAGQQAYLYA